MDPALRANDVKQWAADEGFDACGIATATAIDPNDRLGEWLNRGYQADMDWLTRTREVRQDVQKKLPGAKSVVVLTRNYYTERPKKQPNTGRVSRYAWGRDYHNALKKPLKRLADRIAAIEDNAKCYRAIDTGPIMEKAWAQQAGVGWIGKNSLVLRKGEGSYFFLATILTTVKLAPDPPAFDQCGSCRLCIDACPTDAIVEPRVVDSRKCISYHTIENRGDIPEELHNDFGDWIFGCDICQEVCPWNRNPPHTTLPDFHPRRGHDQIDPDALDEMSEPEFRNEFEGTPITRAKHYGMRRNAHIVRKNTARTDESATDS